MQNFVKFITNNWILVSLFIVFLLAFLLNERREKGNSDSISPQEAISLMNHQEGVVVDLRSEKAFSEGHIVNAINIPADVLEKKFNTLQKYSNRPIILVCAQGNTSAKSLAVLKSKNIKAQSLEGGLTAWRSAGLPLTKKA